MARAVRAETTKLLTLRLCLNTMAGTVLLTVLLSWILTKLIDAAHAAGRPEEAAGLEGGTAFLVVLHYGQIGVILLAAWSARRLTFYNVIVWLYEASCEPRDSNLAINQIPAVTAWLSEQRRKLL